MKSMRPSPGSATEKQTPHRIPVWRISEDETCAARGGMYCTVSWVREAMYFTMCSPCEKLGEAGFGYQPLPSILSVVRLSLPRTHSQAAHSTGSSQSTYLSTRKLYLPRTKANVKAIQVYLMAVTLCNFRFGHLNPSVLL